MRFSALFLASLALVAVSAVVAAPVSHGVASRMRFRASHEPAGAGGAAHHKIDYTKQAEWDGTCKAGASKDHFQSPIDVKVAQLTAAVVPPAVGHVEPLNHTYHAEYNWKTEVNAHTYQVNCESVDATLLSAHETDVTKKDQKNCGVVHVPTGDKVGDPHHSYYVKQFHFHTPSENTIDGKHEALEVHIVHKTDTKTAEEKQKILVQAIMFKVDPAHELDKKDPEGIDTILGELLTKSALAHTPLEKWGFTKPPPVKTSPFAEALAAPQWHWKGSLTTPPCSEEVSWYLSSKVLTISPAQDAKIKALFIGKPETLTGNNRLVQPLNDRPIFVTKPLSVAAVAAK